ncbi:hypothetical protein SPD48_04675 [Pseudogracilibacillus sp. SE30717A]|uniref:hypothetical protein n=1 Tax=Pseudogracilibacillus sp. SE30717A TaxID=3098293 RepID=UPI00300E2FD8
MQNNSCETIIDDLIENLESYFDEKVEDFVILDKTNVPYVMFNIRFTMYKYFNVILNYDRGAYGCAIINGDLGIDLENSQQWYDIADMDVFLQELEQQIELRIPDKFLEYHGWK